MQLSFIPNNIAGISIISILISVFVPHLKLYDLDSSVVVKKVFIILAIFKFWMFRIKTEKKLLQ